VISVTKIDLAKIGLKKKLWSAQKHIYVNKESIPVSKNNVCKKVTYLGTYKKLFLTLQHNYKEIYKNTFFSMPTKFGVNKTLAD